MLGYSLGMPIVIASLTLYPVKSCASVPVARFRCGALGPEFDREWMVVGDGGVFLTQRELPRMALVQPHLERGTLRFTAPGMTEIFVPFTREGREVQTTIFGQAMPARDEGDEAAAWLGQFLGRAVRLVRTTAAGRLREGNDPRAVRFADSYPILLASQSSMRDLNARLPSPLGIERFRANVVIEGAPAWAEDQWRSVRVGEHELRVGKACERCVVTTVDPATGEKGAEPLKTLATFRKNARNKIEFGQYLHSVEGAEFAVGASFFVNQRVESRKS